MEIKNGMLISGHTSATMEVVSAMSKEEFTKTFTGKLDEDINVSWDKVQTYNKQNESITDISPKSKSVNSTGTDKGTK